MPAVVMTASASMPSNCKGIYRHVRVVELCHWDLNTKGWDWRPASISSKEVVRVLLRYGPQHVGKTERSAYHRTIKIAEAWCAEFNSAGDVATAEQLIGAGGSA